MRSLGKYVVSILLFVLTTAIVFSLQCVYGQEWSPVQQQPSPHGIIMQFSYYPASPTINGFTTFQFNVLNLTTNKPLQNYVATVIVGNVAGFTGGSGYFNFSKIVVPNGNFSVNYAFPNDGTFPLYLRVDTAKNIDLARFQVVVPPPTYVLSSGNNTIIYVGVAIAAAGAGAAIVIVQKRKSHGTS